MAGRIANGWELARQSWSVLLADKKLLVFPLISSLACMLVLASFALPVAFNIDWHALAASKGQQVNVQFNNPTYYALLFAFYFANYFVVVFFNAALVACVREQFRGGNPSIGFGLSAAASRLPQILLWALLSATVGMILQMIAERSKLVGQIIVSLLGAAWSIATYFAVPVLVVEKVGPFQVFSRSVSLLKKSWGEAIVANFAAEMYRRAASSSTSFLPGFLRRRAWTPKPGLRHRPRRRQRAQPLRYPPQHRRPNQSRPRLERTRRLRLGRSRPHQLHPQSHRHHRPLRVAPASPAGSCNAAVHLECAIDIHRRPHRPARREQRTVRRASAHPRRPLAQRRLLVHIPRRPQRPSSGSKPPRANSPPWPKTWAATPKTTASPPSSASLPSRPSSSSKWASATSTCDLGLEVRLPRRRRGRHHMTRGAAAARPSTESHSEGPRRTHGVVGAHALHPRHRKNASPTPPPAAPAKSSSAAMSAPSKPPTPPRKAPARAAPGLRPPLRLLFQTARPVGQQKPQRPRRRHPQTPPRNQRRHHHNPPPLQPATRSHHHRRPP